MRQSRIVLPKVKVKNLDSPAAARLPWSRRSEVAFLLSPSRLVLIGFVAMFVAIFGLFGLYNGLHNDRIYSNVRVLGAELGGMDRQEARVALERLGATYPSQGVTVQTSEKTWTLAPADLGLSLDVEKTIFSALAVGRDGGLSSLSTAFSKQDVVPVLAYDAAKIESAVAQLSAELDRAPVDSKLEQDSDGVLLVTPSASGKAVDRVALGEAITGAVIARSNVPILLAIVVVPPAVTEAALDGSATQARTLTGKPLTLKAGKRVWTIEPEQLRNMISVSSAPDGSRGVMIDDAELSEYLAAVADEVKVEPVEALVGMTKDKVTLREDASGQELDMAAALPAIKEAAMAESDEWRVVALPLREVPAAVHTEQVRPFYEKADALVKQGLRLHYGDDGYILRGASVIGFIDFAQEEGGPGNLKVVIDEDVLANRISGVSYNFNRPPTDASFRMTDGRPRRVSAGRTGLKVDVQESLKRAVSAIHGYAGGDRIQVELVVKVTEPQLKDADIASISTPDLIGTGQTSYVGSSAERAHNVELGARKIDGSLVPPGGVFSTVDAVGDLTLDAGYQMGYMIINTGTEIKTIPAEAGGICQVSTTLFHSVFWGGLEVVERNWHSYWIAAYGQDPTGLQGLDSTIAPPEKDFRFKNNTGNWILIRSSAAKGKLVFNIYGVDPGWQVKVGDPVISNRVKTDPTPLREDSSHLPKGKEVKVESAQDGFTSSITRTVLDKSGAVVDKWTANSKYAPARNRYLIGTGPAAAGSEQAP